MAKKDYIADPVLREMAKNHKKPGFGQYILWFVLLLYTIFCFMPFLLVVVCAFTKESCLITNGFRYFPEEWSLSGMKMILDYGEQLAYSYAVTIGITVVGTAGGLVVMSMFAYSLSRPDFRLKGFLTVFLIIPMLFNGGQLSTYIIYSTIYGLKDSLLVLVLPMMVGTMNVIILRTYIKSSIPLELNEAAKIDGANDYRSFFQITFPLMKPSMAAVGFMMATGYWNDWMNARIFIDTAHKKPLQLLLINIQKSIETLMNAKDIPVEVLLMLGGNLPANSVTMATVLVVVGPILCVYPFFQKYFIKGLTVGSVKG